MTTKNKQLKEINFGDKVSIEMKIHGVTNEFYTHKVINRMKSNTWVEVPVQSPATEITHQDIVEVVSCICEGLDETEVLRFRVSDVEKLLNNAYAFHINMKSQQIKDFRKNKAKIVEHYADINISIDEEIKEFSLEEFKKKLGFK